MFIKQNKKTKILIFKSEASDKAKLITSKRTLMSLNMKLTLWKYSHRKYSPH